MRTVLVSFLSSLLLLAALQVPCFATTYVVTNTADAGAGSLRRAITDANAHAGGDRINFAIPITDAGYDASEGVWTIKPVAELPDITEAAAIDGLSQSAFIGSDTNPLGPEIQIDGSLLGVASGLRLRSDGSIVRTLIVNCFGSAGIEINGYGADENTVIGCYLGTDPTGRYARANGRGVLIYTGPQQNVIGGWEDGEHNLLSGNRLAGVEVQGAGANENTIRANFIGTNATGTASLENQYGVYIWAGAQSVHIENNLISGNYLGISIGGTQPGHCRVTGNFIGTDLTGMQAVPNAAGIELGGGGENIIGLTGSANLISGNTQMGILISWGSDNIIAWNRIGTNSSASYGPLPNGNDGILIMNEAQDSFIGPGNRIAWNGENGVRVQGASAIRNKITCNFITGNGLAGIETESGDNLEYSPPIVDIFDPASVRGRALPNSLIEIFSDDEDEGAVYHGSTMADATGHFVWNGTATGPHVTATATDANDNTSEFSQPAASTIASALETSRPLAWVQPTPSRGVARIGYRLPALTSLASAPLASTELAPTELVVRLFDATGRCVRVFLDASPSAGSGEIVWDGRDDAGRSLPSGTYYYRLTAGRAEAAGRILLTK